MPVAWQPWKQPVPSARQNINNDHRFHGHIPRDHHFTRGNTSVSFSSYQTDPTKPSSLQSTMHKISTQCLYEKKQYILVNSLYRTTLGFSLNGIFSLCTIHTHTCASVTKQYNLVPANGRWCLAAGKVTVGLVWPRVTDISGSQPTGSRTWRGRWATA